MKALPDSEYWQKRYERYCRACTRTNLTPLPFDSWMKWHKG